MRVALALCLAALAAGAKAGDLAGVAASALQTLRPAPNNPVQLTIAPAGNGRVVSHPAGIDCGAGCSTPFEKGTLLYLEAQPAPGWHLDHYSGDCSGMECALTLERDAEIGATFARNAPAPAAAKACSDYVGPPPAALHAYEGMMHQHSSYSDGDIHSTPADYYAAGKSRGYSYVAGSEHSDTDDIGVYVDTGAQCSASLGGAVTCLTPTRDRLQKWQATAVEAAQASTDSFLAIRGLEWTSDRFGHINVFFSSNFANAKTDGGYALTMQTFWDWFTRAPGTVGDGGGLTSPVPMGGGADGLATFNHPGDKCNLAQYGDSGCDWNGFAYVPAAADRLFGIEAYNLEQRDDRYQPYIAAALDQGWRLSMIGAEDDHAATFGQDIRPKTVTLATATTGDAFKAAWLARRTYALAPGQHLRAQLDVEGHPMGSVMQCDIGKAVKLDVAVRNRDGSAYKGSLRLFTDGGKELARANTTQASFSLPVASGTHWYFVRVHGADGKSAAYLAPVWIQGR